MSQIIDPDTHRLDYFIKRVFDTERWRWVNSESQRFVVLSNGFKGSLAGAFIVRLLQCIKQKREPFAEGLPFLN